MVRRTAYAAVALSATFLTAAQAAPPNSPTAVTTALYRSYVSMMAGIPKAATQAAWEAKWLTPHFRSSLAALAEATGTDPVIQAQDSCQTWATDITTKLVTSDRNSASIAITLGAHTSGWHSLIASLKMQKGQWRLDGVSAEGRGTGGCS